MESSTPKWTQSGSFFPKSGHFFRFSKRAREVSPLPLSCVPLSVAEYPSISLNMPKYPLNCLNKLFWLCQVSEYAWSSGIFDKLFKMPWILNEWGLRMWRSCICKAYAEFRISLIMAGSIRLNNAWICLNIPYFPLICLKMAEYWWMSLKMPE